MEFNSKFIDHTLLKAFATEKDIEKLCNEAKEYNFKSVCVNPCYVSLAKKLLEGSDVLVCTVIGFPLGANTPETKCFEANDAVRNGAKEVDMVINVGKAKEGNFEYIEKEIAAVKKASNGQTLKVILETCYLTEEEIKQCSIAATKAQADFVKTSTGFGTGGAKVSDVKIMKANISKNMQVKASGGIHTYEDVKALVDAGATRIGASSGVEIMKGFNK